MVAPLEQLLQQYPDKVKIITMNFPLRNHKFARLAAQATLAAHKQGKYWQLHDILMENFGSLNKEKIIKLAGEVGLNVKKLQKDMLLPEITKQINKEMAIGQKVGVRGTPTLFINGKRVTDRSVAGMARMVEEALKR